MPYRLQNAPVGLEMDGVGWGLNSYLFLKEAYLQSKIGFSRGCATATLVSGMLYIPFHSAIVSNGK